jgi:hypothetical protein
MEGVFMAAKNEDEQESKRKPQETPAGYKIPVPKRGDFIRDLEKAAEKPPKKSRRGKGRKKG